MATVSLEEVKTYFLHWQNIIAQYIKNRQILELFMVT